MAKNITRVKWEASGLPFGVSFDERDGTFSGAPEDVGTHVVPVKVTTNYGTDTKDVFLRVEKRTHPLYVIGANAEVRSGGAQADSNGWRICKIPEGERIINLSEGFIVKTEAGTYVCGSIDVTYEQAKNLQANLNKYNVPTLKEEYAGLIHAVNGIVGASNSVNRTNEHYFFWLDENGMLTKTYTATEGYGTNWANKTVIFMQHQESEYYPQSNQIILPEQDGAAFIYNDNNLLFMYLKRATVDYVLIWHMKNLPSGVNVKKILKTFRGMVNADTGMVILTDDGRILQLSFGDSNLSNHEIETGIENIKNIWSDFYTSFIQDSQNNLYVCGSFAGTTYSEFTQIGTFDIKKLLQAGNATVILTNDGKLYYAGQCASIPAMAEQTNNFIQIYPRYSFHDVNLESTDMAALIKYID